MSHSDQIQQKIVKESNPQVLAWAKYDAAQAQFQKLRKKLIQQMIDMEVTPNTDVFSQMHNKIDKFKNSDLLKTIAKSAVTGQALTLIHDQCVQENVHIGKQKEEQLPEKQTTPITQTIEQRINEIPFKGGIDALPESQVPLNNEEQKRIAEFIQIENQNVGKNQVLDTEKLKQLEQIGEQKQKQDEKQYLVQHQKQRAQDNKQRVQQTLKQQNGVQNATGEAIEIPNQQKQGNFSQTTQQKTAEEVNAKIQQPKNEQNIEAKDDLNNKVQNMKIEDSHQQPVKVETQPKKEQNVQNPTQIEKKSQSIQQKTQNVPTENQQANLETKKSDNLETKDKQNDDSQQNKDQEKDNNQNDEKKKKKKNKKKNKNKNKQQAPLNQQNQQTNQAAEKKEQIKPEVKKEEQISQKRQESPQQEKKQEKRSQAQEEVKQEKTEDVKIEEPKEEEIPVKEEEKKISGNQNINQPKQQGNKKNKKKR